MILLYINNSFFSFQESIMDPLTVLTTSAIALATGVIMKVLEKSGENIGESLHDKTYNFIRTLKNQSPDTVTAIEKVPDQPLDYGKAILAVVTAVKNDADLANILQELVIAVQENEDQKIAEKINEELSKIAEVLKNQNNSGAVYNNTIEKLVNLAQGNGNINIQNQTINL